MVSNNKLFGLFVFSLMILLSGCSRQEKEMTFDDQCPHYEPNSVDSVECFLKIKDAQGDVLPCDVVFVFADYSEVRDSVVCENIDQKPLVGRCLYQTCWQKLAVNSHNPDSCKKIDQKSGYVEDRIGFRLFIDRCYSDSAWLLNNSLLCQNITEDGFRQECLGFFKNLDEDSKNDKLARISKESGFCSKIEDDFYRDGCFASLGVCDKIIKYNKDSCYDVLVNKKGADVCDDIAEIKDRDNCYNSAGQKFKDESICNKISSEDLRKLCQDTVKEYKSLY